MNNITNKRSTTARIPHLDYFRGIIIFLMIQGHLFRALLEPGIKGASWFRIHEYIHGVVAPGFLFLAGYLFYHTIHNKGQSEFLIKARQLSGIVLLGYFLHLPFFSLTKIIEFWGTGIEYKLFRMDILQTIGFSLLTALFIWVFIRRFFIPLIMILVLFNIISPFINAIPDNLFLASFIDGNISQFPMIFWSFYLFLGILASRFLKKFNILLLLTSILLMVTATKFPSEIIRIISDTGKVLFLFSIIRLLPGTGSILLKKFLTASRESLFLYMSHLMIIYGSPLNPGLFRYFRDSLSMPVATILFIVLALILYTAAYFLNRFRSKKPDSYNSLKYALLTFFSLIFIMSRW
ncbi:MAG: hypothetical protein ABFR36_05790 [Acidobacteriota bacterium]